MSSRTATLNAITNTGGGELKIAILPTFGSRWLIPRLSSFLENNLDIDVSFINRFVPFDFNMSNWMPLFITGNPTGLMPTASS